MSPLQCHLSPRLHFLAHPLPAQRLLQYKHSPIPRSVCRFSFPRPWSKVRDGPREWVGFTRQKEFTLLLTSGWDMSILHGWALYTGESVPLSLPRAWTAHWTYTSCWFLHSSLVRFSLQTIRPILILWHAFQNSHFWIYSRLSLYFRELSLGCLFAFFIYLHFSLMS